MLAYEGPDRRQQERRNAPPFVSPQLSGGWLCFESDVAKRRLAPAPETWEDVDDVELGSFWKQAEPVAPRKIQIPGIAPHRLP